MPHNNVFSVSLEEVKANFARYDLLDDQVRFVPGWFQDSLPTAPIEQLVVLRLDCEHVFLDYRRADQPVPEALQRRLCNHRRLKLLPRCHAVDDFRAKNVIDDVLQDGGWKRVLGA